MDQKKRAWLYCRIDAPEDENGRLKGQKKELTDYAEQMGFTIILALQVHKILTTKPHILLAGHFCIFDERNNVDFLPETIFYNLEIESILLLEATTSKIIENLSARDKKEYTHQQVLALQNAEREKAQKISVGLGCKLNLHNMRFDETDIQICLSYLNREGEL